MRISDWSSDVCSSDLVVGDEVTHGGAVRGLEGSSLAAALGTLGLGGSVGAVAVGGGLGGGGGVHRVLPRRVLLAYRDYITPAPWGRQGGTWIDSAAV